MVIQDAAYFVFLFILSIVFHELGHYTYWRFRINKNVRFISGFNVEGRHQGEVKNHKLMKYYMAGVISGFVVLPAFYSFYWALLWLVAYLFGCRDDFRQIKKIMRG